MGMDHKFMGGSQEDYEDYKVMAGSGRQTSLSRTSSIRGKLSLLSCPYLEGLNDGVVHELLLTPGEARLRLLEWLVGSLHPQLQQAITVTASENSRIAKLADLLSEAGLCTSTDHELVKGTAPVWKQLQFLDTLLDLLILSKPVLKGEPDNNSAFTGAIKMMQQSCLFLDELCRHEDLSTLFPSSISLIPPDIALASKIKPSELVEKKWPRSRVPDLLTELTQTRSLLQDKQQQYDELNQKCTFSRLDPAVLDSNMKSLSVSLQTFTQLLDNFIHSYETEIHQWSNKELPQMSPLSPVMRRVSTHLTTVDQLLEGVAEIEETMKQLLQMDSICIGDNPTHKTAEVVIQNCLKQLK